MLLQQSSHYTDNMSAKIILIWNPDPDDGILIQTLDPDLDPDPDPFPGKHCDGAIPITV